MSPQSPITNVRKGKIMNNGIKFVKNAIKKDLDKSSKEIDYTKMSDYCEVGYDQCFSCGWVGKYVVSSCPFCHVSFCE